MEKMYRFYNVKATLCRYYIFVFLRNSSTLVVLLNRNTEYCNMKQITLA
jgi:hypothetical protein